MNLKLKIRNSIKGSTKVIIKPQYIIAAFFGTLLASALILWSLNLSLLRYIFFEAPVSLRIKFEFFFDVYGSLYTTYTSVQGTTLVIFSVLFGINLALLVFVLKNRAFSSIPKKSGIGGFLFAIVGGGCVACGTSLIAPVLATLGAGTAPLLRDISTIFNVIGSILILFSIYKLGEVCSMVMAKNKLDQQVKK